MFVTLRGVPYLLWRAVDKHCTELEVLVQKWRDKVAAKRCFRRVMRSNPAPRKIVTDQLRSYPAPIADILELAQVKHVFVRGAARVNNRAEKPTSRPAGASARCADFAMGVACRRFSSFGPIRQHFALPRHQMSAAYHRAALRERFAKLHSWSVTVAAKKTI